MNDKPANRDELRPHPTNPNWTMPKSFGVWKLPDDVAAGVKLYRYGNYPVRGTELEQEFGAITLVEVYYSRMVAKRRAAGLNDPTGTQDEAEEV